MHSSVGAQSHRPKPPIERFASVQELREWLIQIHEHDGQIWELLWPAPLEKEPHFWMCSCNNSLSAHQIRECAIPLEQQPGGSMLSSSYIKRLKLWCSRTVETLEMDVEEEQDTLARDGTKITDGYVRMRCSCASSVGTAREWATAACSIGTWCCRCGRMNPADIRRIRDLYLSKTRQHVSTELLAHRMPFLQV